MLHHPIYAGAYVFGRRKNDRRAKLAKNEWRLPDLAAKLEALRLAPKNGWNATKGTLHAEA